MIFLAPDVDSREAYALLYATTRWEQSRQILWDFVKANYDELLKHLPTGGGFDAGGMLPYVGGSGCDEPSRQETALAEGAAAVGVAQLRGLTAQVKGLGRFRAHEADRALVGAAMALRADAGPAAQEVGLRLVKESEPVVKALARHG